MVTNKQQTKNQIEKKISRPKTTQPFDNDPAKPNAGL